MKVLWISPFFLHPTDRGGQIRSLGTLRELHKRHEIHFVGLNPPGNTEGPARSGEYCTRAVTIPHQPPARGSLKMVPQLLRTVFSSVPLAVSRYHSRKMEHTVRRMLAETAYDCVVCDFLACAPNVPAMGDCILFQHNVETTIWQRHAQEATSYARRMFFAVQARRMERYERKTCRAAKFVIAVSELDAKRMRDQMGVSRVQGVPTGVDTEFYRDPGTLPKSSDMVFSGSMDWLPNVDAVEYFLREVFPLILRERPDATFTIAGRSPDPRVLQAAAAFPGVTVTGSVPDIRQYLWGSRLSVIPLRIGGGTRLKVYECMAAGLPIVSTSIGAEGLAYTPGRDLLLEDSAAAMAEQCVRLLQDDNERNGIAANARTLVEDNFSWPAAVRDFEHILQSNAKTQHG